MNTMTKLFGLSVSLLALTAVACGDDGVDGEGGSDTTSSSSNATSSSTGDATSSSSSGMPAPNVPALGNQIDRMGRAAINTATTQTFADDATRSAAEDAYNSDDNIATWVGDYADGAAFSLGILDSLDAVCGNGSGAAGSTMAGAYGTVASVLATDYIAVKGDAAEGCDNSYLSVELGVLGMANDLCGGRTPAHDSIATTYTVVAGVPFDDGVTAPSKSQVETFPYLAPVPAN